MAPSKEEIRTRHILDTISGHNHKGEESWLREFLLHSRSIHLILVTLLLVDGAICLVSGVLESNYYHSARDDCAKFVDKCVEKTHHRRLGTFGVRPLSEIPWLDAPNWPFLSKAPTRSLAASNGWTPAAEDASFCNSVHTDSLDNIKHSFGNEDLHTAEIYLCYISIGILAFFFLEQMLLLFELRSEYCKGLFLLDLFIISSSIAIEVLVVFKFAGPSATAGLLVLARAWRFARVGHGVFETTEQIEEIIEEDDTFETMKGAWDKFSDDEWKEIRQAGKQRLAEDLTQSATAHDIAMLAVAKQVGTNPVAVLRSLAYAKAWKHHVDKKAFRAKAAKAVSVEESSRTSL